jgi:hypothetical protein
MRVKPRFYVLVLLALILAFLGGSHQLGVLRDSNVCTRTVDRVAFFCTAVLEQLTFCVDRTVEKRTQ